MLQIEDTEYFNSVLEFANKMGDKYKQNLEKKLEFLENYGGSKEYCTCKLFKDWAQYSFGFVLEKDGKRMFNGGLIYHGQTPGEHRENPLAVNLNMLNGTEVLWSIHT